MPELITAFTLKDLRDQIKQESRLKGSSDSDGLINDLINELLLTYAINNKYFELLKTNIPITTSIGEGSYQLPIDFIHFENATYKDLQDNRRTLYERTGFLSQPNGRNPKYWQLSGNTLQILPYDNVLDGETILIDYYAAPAKLEEDEDAFPIPRLIAPLKRTAIYRALLFNSQPTATSFKGDAAEAEARGKPTSRPS